MCIFVFGTPLLFRIKRTSAGVLNSVSYIHICVCVYMYIHTYLHTYIHMCMCVSGTPLLLQIKRTSAGVWNSVRYTHVCMYACVYIFMYACMHYMHAWLKCMYVHMYVCISFIKHAVPTMISPCNIYTYMHKNDTNTNFVLTCLYTHVIIVISQCIHTHTHTYIHTYMHKYDTKKTMIHSMANFPAFRIIRNTKYTYTQWVRPMQANLRFETQDIHTYKHTHTHTLQGL
jgi:hypothetical protein